MELTMRTHMKMYLHAMSKRGFILTFVLFCVAFTSSVLIGVFLGPPLLVSYAGQNSNLAMNWTGSVTHLSKLHQQLVLYMQVHNEVYEHVGFIDLQVTLSVSVDGGIIIQDGSVNWTLLTSDVQHTLEIACTKGNDMCDSVIIAHEPFIAWNAYRYHVNIVEVVGPAVVFTANTTFTFTYINDAFTLFEMWIRFVFLFFSFMVFVIFMVKLRRYAWRDWSVEQKWVSVLLFGTFAFNDPFFSISILVSGWFPQFLDISMFASFLVLLLLFWLVIFDGIRQEDTKRSFLKFYLPKMVVLGLFWISVITGFTLYSIHELDDHSTLLHIRPYILFFKVAMLIALLAYSFWLGYIVCRACGMMGSMPFLSVRLKFFGLFTLIIFVITIAGVFFGVFTPLDSNAAEYLAFLSLLNLYVYTLAFVYLPSGGISREEISQRVGVATLEDDRDGLAMQERTDDAKRPHAHAYIDEQELDTNLESLESE